MNKYFKKENKYPNEAFVQEAIEKYFVDHGYRLLADKQVDLIAEKNGEIWIVEAKGITSSIGVDFNTCLGQLTKSMVTDEYYYAIAVPKLYKYERQCKLLSPYFRKLVRLHFILVDEEGNITMIQPENEIDWYFNNK